MATVEVMTPTSSSDVFVYYFFGSVIVAADIGIGDSFTHRGAQVVLSLFDSLLTDLGRKFSIELLVATLEVLHHFL